MDFSDPKALAINSMKAMTCEVNALLGLEDDMQKVLKTHQSHNYVKLDKESFKNMLSRVAATRKLGLDLLKLCSEREQVMEELIKEKQALEAQIRELESKIVTLQVKNDELAQRIEELEGNSTSSVLLMG